MNSSIEDRQLSIFNSCRICLQRDEELHSIFSVSISDIELHKIVMSLAPITILENDGLSEKVCVNCQEKILTAYDLQQMCVQSDKSLRSMLKQEIEEDVELPNICIYKIKEIPEDSSEFNNFEFKQDNNDVQYLDGISTKANDHIKEELSIHIFSFKCNQCPQEFNNLPEFNEHQLLHLNALKEISKKESIKEIDYKIDDQIKKLKKRPKKSGKKLKKHKCAICDKVFNIASTLARHMNSKKHNAALSPFECPDCPQRFSTEQRLNRHSVLHSSLISPPVSAQRHFCMICSKEFSSHKTMTVHLKIHKKELEKKDFQCDLCPKIFKNLVDFTRHSNQHLENKEHRCNVCNKYFAKGNYLIDHLNSHKGLGIYQCDFCQKRFQYKNTIRNHLIIHMNVKPYTCDKCPRSFNSNSNLKNHIKRHLNIKNYCCTMCPFKFAVQGDLAAHMATHGGGKSFTCDVCGNSFTKSGSLKEHKLVVHGGFRRFECETCKKKFSTAEHLKRHFRIHTGEKPYKCTYLNCDLNFAQIFDLKKHKRIHVGDNIYTCEICNEGFKLHSLLRQHWKTHAGHFESMAAESSVVKKGETFSVS